MSDHQEAKQATSPETLLTELLDSRVPKSEREHVAKREIERLRADLETERMRLVACGVAALANTADSAARARDILPEYRSASLDDVERTVDREIQLRSERDELRRQLAEAEMDAMRYRWLRGSSCPDHSRRWTLWEIRHWRAPFWTGDLRHGDLDAAIDAQLETERPE